MAKKNEASVDSIYQGIASGDVASRLLSTDMNVNALRPFIGKDGRPYMTVNDNGNSRTRLVGNATLRKDEWKHMDETVVQISRERLVGWSDLANRGLIYNVPNGLGRTVLEYEDVSDMEAASISMDGMTEAGHDRVKFSIKYLPLPLVHADFQINARVLEASRKLGQPLDTTQAAMAATKVAEKVEEILFVGASTYTFGGGTIYGYLDHTSANSVTISANWDDSAASGETIIADVIAMKQASIDKKRYGPWMLYIPTNFETAVDDDFKAASDKTIRQRLKEITGILDVKVADKLTDDYVVLVEMRPETVRGVVGLQTTTVEWQTHGGMVTHYKVMAIMVPQIRADQDGNCGLVVLSA